MCLVGVSLNSIPYVILYLSRSISPSPTQFGQSKPVRPAQTREDPPMGLIKKSPPSVRFVAVFSAEDRFLRTALERLEAHWGKIAALGQAFDFVESPYYLRTMLVPQPPESQPAESQHDHQPPRALRKQMALFADPYDAAELAADKLQSNRWERDWTEELTLIQDDSKRLINIDPGYLSMTKLVLASTKNREHRIYLRDGIYAEVTLAFRDQAWTSMPWTYADYQRPDVLEFLKLARKGFTSNLASRSLTESDP
jgi:hypothetical protein